MKLLLLVFLIQTAAAGTFDLKLQNPQIKIGSSKTEAPLSGEYPSAYVALTWSGISFHLPSLRGQSDTFAADLPGVNLGKRFSNQLLNVTGFLEIAGDWSRFKRDSTIYSQTIDLLSVSASQNAYLSRGIKRLYLLSGGVGIAPLYLMSSKNVLSDSLSELGFLGFLKSDFEYKKFHSSLKIGWGNVADQSLFLSTIGVGINFE